MSLELVSKAPGGSIPHCCDTKDDAEEEVGITRAVRIDNQ
jgi:hypothetical protein